MSYLIQRVFLDRELPQKVLKILMDQFTDDLLSGKIRMRMTTEQISRSTNFGLALHFSVSFDGYDKMLILRVEDLNDK